MSLLMEALRKAEEAKRQAAQKEKETPGSGVPAPAGVAEPSLLDDPVALEAQMSLASEASSAAEPVVEPVLTFDLPVSESVQTEAPSLDVPFDFHIDESFGALDLKPAPVSKPDPLQESSVAPAMNSVSAPEPEPEPEPEPVPVPVPELV